MGVDIEANALIVMPHARAIERSARGYWSYSHPVRAVLGEAADAVQQALLYCLLTGLREHHGDIALAAYFWGLARRGLWQAAQSWRGRRAIQSAPVEEELPEAQGSRKGTVTQAYYHAWRRNRPDGVVEYHGTLSASYCRKYGIDLADQDNGIDAAMAREDIVQALELLPARQREAVVLRYGLHGQTERTTEEVATMLGIGLASAKNLTYRGVETLRGVFKVDGCE